NQNLGARGCKPGEHGYVWGSCEAASCNGSEQFCVTSAGEEGLAACVDGKTASPCGVVGDCHPGQTSSACGGAACKLMGDTWALPTCGNGSSTVATPLVLAFRGESVT